MREKLFCHLHTGSDGRTNLQLFSLCQAAHVLDRIREYRADPPAELADEPDFLESKIKEACIFVISCLGLSLTQVLGQNSPDGAKPKIPGARRMLSDFLASTEAIALPEKDLISAKAKDFFDIYDACRHFGISKHPEVANVNIEATERYMQFVKTIWNALIRDRLNDCEEVDISSIDEVMSGYWQDLFLPYWPPE